MRARAKIISVGFVWGWLEASVLFLAILFLGVGQASGVLDFGPGWRAGILSAFLISFGAGMLLIDFENTIRALLLATFIAFSYSIMVATVLAVPFSASPSQGYAEALFFGFLGPIFFFVGLVASMIGSVFGGWLIPKIRRREKQSIRPLPELKPKLK